MALNRDKFRKIVGGITTTVEPDKPAAAPEPVEPSIGESKTVTPRRGAGQGSQSSGDVDPAGDSASADHRRFAKRGRPKGRKDDVPASKGPKVKVSLFLSEYLVNDFYEWAHADKMHPGEMFEQALKPFHERETKRRNAGKG